jgi:hypothetical protein
VEEKWNGGSSRVARGGEGRGGPMMACGVMAAPTGPGPSGVGGSGSDTHCHAARGGKHRREEVPTCGPIWSQWLVSGSRVRGWPVGCVGQLAWARPEKEIKFSNYSKK